MRGRARGGILVAFNQNKYNAEIISKTEECITAKFLNRDSKFEFIVSSVYISPTKDIDVFLSSFEDLIEQVIIKYPNLPFYIGGDFNSRIANLNQLTNQVIEENFFVNSIRYNLDEKLDTRGKKLVEFMERNAFIVLNGRTRGDNPSQYTFVSTVGKSTIDLAWTNFAGLCEVKNFFVHCITTTSDHFPISIKLFDINDRNKIEKELFCLKWKGELKEEYKSLMSNTIIEIENNEDVNDISNIMVECIYEKAYNLGMQNKVKAVNIKSKPWFDSECVTLKNNLKNLLKKCKNNNFASLEMVKDYNETKKEYKCLQKNKKEEYKNCLLDRLSSVRDSNNFWKIINMYRSRFSVRDQINLKEWHNYFQSVFPLVSNVPVIMMPLSNPYLEKRINHIDIEMSLKKCREGKSPGSDGISYEFWKSLPENWINYLTNLFNKIMDKEQVPNSWAKILAKMIYKKGEKSNPENYRPIALVNTIAKIFTQILAGRLNEWVEDNGFLPEWQAGFRNNRSCIDNIFALNATIQSRLHRSGGKLFVLFIDFRGAFPSVTHSLLWDKLSKMGLGNKFINILIDLYSKAEIAVKGSSGISEYTRVTLGVLQGEVLSPLLFSCFIADFEEFLRAEGIRGVSVNHLTEIVLYAYADDIAIPADTCVEMRKIIKALKKYCVLKKLEINVKKTQMIIFRKGGHCHNHKYGTFMYDDKQKIEVVSNYDYLGVTFSNSAIFLNAANTAISKANLALGATVSLINRLQLKAWDPVNKLFKSLTVSNLTYVIQIWGLRYLEEIEKIQNSFYKKILHLPQNTPNYAVRLETGVPRLSVLVFKYTLNLIEKILLMEDSRYPKICFLRLRQLAREPKSDSKFNWYKQVGGIFDLIEEKMEWENLTVTRLQIKKKHWINKYESYLYSEDIKRKNESRSLQIFPHLVLFKGPQKYFQNKISLDYIRVLSQIRLLNNIVTKIKINKNTYSLGVSGNCSECGVNITEMFFHLLIECPSLLVERGRYISEDQDDSIVKTTFLNMLEKPQNDEMKNLYYYIKAMCEKIGN